MTRIDEQLDRMLEADDVPKRPGRPTATMSHSELMALFTDDVMRPKGSTRIYCPPPLLRVLDKLDLVVVRSFVILMRETESAGRERQVVADLERVLTPRERARIARAIPVRWASRHPSMEALRLRWIPVAPTIRTMPRDDPGRLTVERAYKYGLTHENALAVLVAQDYRCAICRVTFNHPDETCMDHNHESGAFRAILCISCNTGLGLLKDSVPVLKAALTYLEQHGSYGPKELP